MNREEQNQQVEELLTMLAKCAKIMNSLGWEKAFEVLGGQWIYTKNPKRFEQEMHWKYMERIAQEMATDLARQMKIGFGVVGMEINAQTRPTTPRISQDSTPISHETP